jgi:uncharacterized protein YjbI with pentapeptide repeats
VQRGAEMVACLRSWWQQIKQHLVTILAVAITLIIAIALIIVGYRFDWTGFNGNNKSGKTLWDWLQLLFVPAVLTLGAIWYTARQNHDLQITLDNQRETMLQTYFDKMSELLLHENLRQSEPGADVVNIAHARTLTVLPKLDPSRKRSIVLFLVESGLIDRNKWIIDMSYADLREVDLSQVMKLESASLEGAYLQGANLSGADLSRANLEGTKLSHANLSRTQLWEASLKGADVSGADLMGADLTKANLKDIIGITVEELERQAKSLKGAIMPNGGIHP